tara:strand:- start:9 stop:140 length:132 start_codon:yes stop_codon:yes gene_type:complete
MRVVWRHGLTYTIAKGEHAIKKDIGERYTFTNDELATICHLLV